MGKNGVLNETALHWSESEADWQTKESQYVVEVMEFLKDAEAKKGYLDFPELQRETETPGHPSHTQRESILRLPKEKADEGSSTSFKSIRQEDNILCDEKFMLRQENLTM
ncbi:hypothetical protein NQD34_000764 [Periophthalmus magnuspinnatus]|nr:hypothetical protein NQD34_000764 [Periophthalmus magnuspinnatus]